MLNISFIDKSINLEQHSNSSMHILYLNQPRMHQQTELFATKYATFNSGKIDKSSPLLQYLRKEKQNSELEDLLQHRSEWQIYSFVSQQQIPRPQFLQSMIKNSCKSINLKYFWDDQTKFLIHIQFTRLKELIFSVDSDCGYLESIQFLVFMNAPNLVKLDLSNMEYGGYSLSPLKKCYFPKLQFLELSTEINSFREYEQLSYAYFPKCRQINLFNDSQGSNQVSFQNRWRAKIQSRLITKEYAAQLFPFSLGNLMKKRRKM